MAKRKAGLFIHLSWDDLRDWAGFKILARGQSYQRQNRVSKLAVFNDCNLLAWVEGTNRYANSGFNR